MQLRKNVILFLSIFLPIVIIGQNNQSQTSSQVSLKTMTQFKDSIDAEIKSAENRQKYSFYGSLASAGITILLKVLANQSYDDYENATNTNDAKAYWNSTKNLDISTYSAMGLTSGLLLYSGYGFKEVSDLDQEKNTIPIMSKKYFGDSILLSNNIFENNNDEDAVILGIKQQSKTSYGLIFSKISNGMQIEFGKEITKFDYNIPKNIMRLADSTYLVHLLTGENQKSLKDRLIKIGDHGKIIWEYEITDSNSVSGNSLFLTNDSGCIFIVDEILNNNVNSSKLLKLNSNGALQWSKILSTDKNAKNKVFYLNTLTSNYKTLKKQDSSIYFNTINESGKLLNEKIIDVGKNSLGYIIKETNDSGFILLVNKYPTDKSPKSVQLKKFDSLLNLSWEKTFYNVQGYNVIQNYNNGYVITGEKSFSDEDETIWTVITDSTGSKLNSQHYKNLGLGIGFGIIEQENGCYTILGVNNSKYIIITTYSFN